MPDETFLNFKSFWLALKAYAWWQIAIELFLIGFVVYWVIRFLRGTRGARMLKGIGFVLFVLYVIVGLIGDKFGLTHIVFLYKQFLIFASVATVVVFQPELRRALMRLGETRLFRSWSSQLTEEIDALVEATSFLSKRKIGALVAIERDIGLGGIAESGTRINADLSASLLETIFWPNSPLHDLGVIVSQGKIAYAGVQFPLAESGELERELGSRHRAAVGMSQDSDAIVLVVSEETGDVSIAERGKLLRKLTADSLRQRLTEMLGSEGMAAAREAADAADVPPETQSTAQRRVRFIRKPSRRWIMTRSNYDEPRPISESWRKFFINEWRIFLASFTKEKVISSLKTLAWVAPLTLLIWIYAERETVSRSDAQAVPFEPVGDSSRIVSVIRPSDRNFILKLEGPRAKLQAVLQELQPPGLKIEIPSTYGVDVDAPIPALGLVQDQKIFRDNGITVLDCQPPTLLVRIDSVAEVKVPVQPPPEIQNLDGPPTFTPAEVTLKGPRRLFQQGKLAVQADLAAASMRKPDRYKLNDIAVELPPSLRDQQVTISPPKVNADVTIREADASYKFDGIPVFISVPPPGELLRQYKIVYKASLSDVTVIGPKDIIDTISKPGYAPLPNATLKILNEDARKIGKQQKTVTYDLGNTALRVSDADKNKTVEFELIEIPAADRPAGD